jgi:hypothetical protein
MDQTQLITIATIATTAASTEAGKKLITPVVEQIGLALGDFASIYRFYQNENLGKIFTKWAESRKEKSPLTDEDIRKILPLIPLASVQSDNDLQSRWAALLEYTVASESGVLPSFGQTLSQLTADEAKFIDRLFEFVMQPGPYLPQQDPGRIPMGRVKLIEIYDPTIHTGVNSAERQLFKDKFTTEQKENFEKLDQAGLIIQDLERLRILVQEWTSEPDEYLRIPPTGNSAFDASIAGKKVALYRSRAEMQSHYSLSPYGVSFIRAVSPRKMD